MKTEQVKIEIGGKELTIGTGKMAKQAHGSVTVQCGGTVVLVTAVCAKTARESVDFFPLTVEYQEKTFAAGKIPGGFFKREGRPSEKAILTSRMIDRPIRPLFPKGQMNEVQVIATVLSLDDENDADMLAITGASAALSISDIPFNGPIGAVRVGLVGDEFVLNPTFEQLEESKLDLVVVANEDDVIMLEAGADAIGEEKMLEAIKFGAIGVGPLLKLQNELRKKCGKTKREDIVCAELNEEIYALLKEKNSDKINKIMHMPDADERAKAIEILQDERIKEEVTEESNISEKNVRDAFSAMQKELMRAMVLKEKKRVDGRAFDQVRALDSEINLLPNTHGSALFTRGETQALAVITLGTGSDEQIMDALEGEYKRKFMLHYNFPPFSVGEARFLRGPGRREIGHGALAAKALKPILPDVDSFPYTIRLVSEILESNGSSSMATVCAGSLSLMASGVPVKNAVSGIAMGLVKEGDDYAILTDIAGLEDHCGDMDFKVAGTKDGITALQMDLKIKGVSLDELKEGFEKARNARISILDHMRKTIAEPLAEVAANAPRIVTIDVPVDKIRDVIGPGGKIIRGIIAETGADINIEDDGSCQVASANKESLDQAVKMVRDIIAEPEVGKVYDGKITKLMAFGAFCEFMPGKEGLIHVSELSGGYVKDVASIVKEGDAVKVVLFEIDKQGRNNLSVKRVKDAGSGPKDKK
ncbi:MAG: polyribonucleotide nucleotidyltransferase [Candidatus Omnitrophica bacterium]|nr:polyribonucleotide nucleotidyltransferase [Candidatus Omnitrophota bacterium]MBU1128837.1 polyribonucleotide nucleotidyltransferase [Candidatus Omnitrophota bacterium]MBU1783770.1 polyribonucleotide nucleotidyltransferase [Candidatus Omnitrophota bacterium]MBU1852137.1 polyribonucleotide nucleotidyltransferase [Candidatus Omnitrophota bacterium]